MTSLRRRFARLCVLLLIGYGFLVSPKPTHRIVPRELNRPAYWQSTSVRRRQTIKKPSDAQLCLAQVLYFEAKSEPMMGLEAVAATVFNRMTLPQYPRTVCGVIYQSQQYSWTANHANWTRRPPKHFFALARNFMGMRSELAQLYPVTHFHHYASRPHWSSSLDYYGQYGAHQFYRVTNSN